MRGISRLAQLAGLPSLKMGGASVNALQSKFLAMAAPAAIQSQTETGVPASITIAQAILESGWGATGLARRANNYFGIKAAHHVAPDCYIELPTREMLNGHYVTENGHFMRYTGVADCFKAHGLLLSQASRYAPAMAVRNEPEKFAAEIQHCGYSTNPNYAALLMKIVNQFDLTQYDVHPK